jgi:hypothetical protein
MIVETSKVLTIVVRDLDLAEVNGVSSSLYDGGGADISSTSRRN